MKPTTLNGRTSFEDLIPSFKSRGMNLSLERMIIALNKMGNPCENIPAIQIAGTNGKGSISCFLESCLVEAGIITGCTTSPHLITWCERIRVNGQMISEETFRESIEKVKSYSSSEDLTPFEMVIAAAFNHFSLNKVELMILEVGLGGRLDATTSHPNRPVIAMAGIGLDHCEFLGKSLEKIAKEKAGVITPGCKVISAKQSPAVERILKETVAKKNANISWVSPLPETWKLGLAGEVQRSNAAVAKAALEEIEKIGLIVSEEQIKKGLASANFPGRLQKTNWKNYPLILDGAHNPHAFQQLSKERSKWASNDKFIHWIIGIQIQKDAPTMLRSLLKKNDFAWIVPVPNHESWNKENIAIACPDLSNQIYKAKGVNEVLKALELKEKWPSPPPVVTGSLYLIGELLKSLEHFD